VLAEADSCSKGGAIDGGDGVKLVRVIGTEAYKVMMPMRGGKV
jgi:hypothetical protein